MKRTSTSDSTHAALINELRHHLSLRCVERDIPTVEQRLDEVYNALVMVNGMGSEAFADSEQGEVAQAAIAAAETHLYFALEVLTSEMKALEAPGLDDDDAKKHLAAARRIVDQLAGGR